MRSGESSAGRSRLNLRLGAAWDFHGKGCISSCVGSGKRAGFDAVTLFLDERSKTVKTHEVKCLSCRQFAALPNQETCGRSACLEHVKEAEKWAKKVCDRVLSHWKR